jgi:hypothetical protein
VMALLAIYGLGVNRGEKGKAMPSLLDTDSESILSGALLDSGSGTTSSAPSHNPHCDTHHAHHHDSSQLGSADAGSHHSGFDGGHFDGGGHH